MTTSEIIPIMEYFFSKTQEYDFCSPEELIRYTIERYLRVTRGNLILLERDDILELLSTLEYSVVGMKDGDFLFNLDSRSIDKAALARKPRVCESDLKLIKNFDHFFDCYGVGLRALIEGSEKNQVYTNDNGMYTLFEYDNKTFKVQLINGFYMAELFNQSSLAK